MFLKPTEHPYKQLKVRANIEFDDRNNRKYRVKDAVWLTLTHKIAVFKKGDTISLVLGILPASNKFTLYEHNIVVSPVADNKFEVELNPKLTAVDGEEFDIKVELIGEFNNEFIKENLRFRLSLKPEPQITEIKN